MELDTDAPDLHMSQKRGAPAILPSSAQNKDRRTHKLFRNPKKEESEGSHKIENDQCILPDIDEDDLYARELHKNFGSYFCSSNYLNDLIISVDDDGWKSTPDAQKWAAHTAHFNLVRDWNNDIVDLNDVDTTPFSSCVFYQNSSWHVRASYEELELDVQDCDPEESAWM